MYHAIMQEDGNFVIYRGSLADKPTDALWRTKTNQHSNGPYHLDLHPDNNLVLYDIYQQPIWFARVKKGVPPPRLNLQDDGNLVMYDVTGKKIWAADIISAKKYKVKVTKPPKKPKKTNGWD